MADAGGGRNSDVAAFRAAFAEYQRGGLGGHRYTSAAFYDREWEAVWTKSWLVLGRSSSVPEPGDFAVDEIGRESFVMARQDDGSLKTFYNVCPHRGNRLVHEAEGCVGSFTCNYHSWKWGLDGVLESMQDAETFPGGSPCGKIRLSEVRCEEFSGFVWINMDPGCISLQDYLGPLWDAWQVYPLDRMTRIQAYSVNLPCNWKALIDNFTETYHFATVHPNFLNYVEDFHEDVGQEIFEGGHGLVCMKAATSARRFIESEGLNLAQSLRDELEFWEIDPDALEGRPAEARLALQRRKREIGEARGHRHYAGLSDQQLTDVRHYTVFPNFAVGLLADGMVFHRLRPHPTDPNRSIYDAFQFVPSDVRMMRQGFGNVADDAQMDAPTEAPIEVIDYGARSIGPVLDQDAATMAGQQLGLRSRGYTGGYLTDQEFRVAYYHFMIDRYIARHEG